MKGIVAAALLCALFSGCMVSKEAYEAEYVKGRELEAVNEDLSRRLAAEKKKSEDQKAELSATAEKLERLRSEKGSADASLADLSSRLERCQSSGDSLGGDLDVARKALRTAEQEKAELRARMEARERDYNEAARAKEAEFAAKARDCETEIAAREARIETLRGRISDVEAERSVLQEEREKFQLERKEKIDEMSKTYEGLLANMKEEIGQGRVTISRLRDKLSLKLMDEILFPSGSAEVKEEGRKVLDHVAEALRGIPDKAILIEGHTDDVPISGALATKFSSNWELSTARAVSVVRYLTEKAGVDPARISAVGYGEHRPVGPNDTPEGKARNRRIEIKLAPLERPEEEAVAPTPTPATPAEAAPVAPETPAPPPAVPAPAAEPAQPGAAR